MPTRLPEMVGATAAATASAANAVQGAAVAAVGAARSPRSTAAGFSSLPDDLLILVLVHLGLGDR